MDISIICREPCRDASEIASSKYGFWGTGRGIMLYLQ